MLHQANLAGLTYTYIGFCFVVDSYRYNRKYRYPVIKGGKTHNYIIFLIIFSPVFITHPFFIYLSLSSPPLQTRYFLFYFMCCHNFDHLDFWGGSAWVVKSLGYPRGGKLTQNKFKNLPHLQLETSEAVFFSGWKWRKNVLNWSKMAKRCVFPSLLEIATFRL